MLENTTNGATVEVAEPQTQTQADSTSEVAEKSAESVASSQQSAEENAKFADRRRKQELEQTRGQLAAANKRLADYQALENSLKASGFNGTAAEIADQIAASARGVSVETIREERLSQQQQADIRSERDMYKAELNKMLISADIEKIKAKYPDIEVLEDLPDGFVDIMATGKIKDPVLAYEMLMPKKDTPVSTGSVKGKETIEKEFFTRDEVKNMSRSEIKKNYEKIIASQKKW
ncbi:MAG: hypothetical protein IJN27_01675 [Oscillospiraceae bacterium]|nr:hypothetical protein [Oscillospiraceae bacterium]